MEIETEAPVFTLSASSNGSILYAGCIDGALSCYNIDISENAFSTIDSIKRRVGIYSSAIRGNNLGLGSYDGQVSVLDSSILTEKWQGERTSASVGSTVWYNDHVILGGDFDCGIRLFDIRSGYKPIVSINECDDGINDMIVRDSNLFVVAGDKLSVFDLRQTFIKLNAMSDEMDDDLTCVSVVSDRSRILVGSNDGVCVFFEDDYGTYKERLGTIESSINSIVALKGHNQCLIGGDNGEILACTANPNNIAGVIAYSNDAGIDTMVVDTNETFVATADVSSHIICVRSLSSLSALLQGDKTAAAKSVEASFYDDFSM